jgi:transcriptional regulator with XRE-family HTH domain
MAKKQAVQRGAGTYDVEVGNRMRAYRLERGLSQEAVADKLGLTFQQVQKYEKGVNRIAVGRLAQLSRLFECEPHDLMGWQQKSNNLPPAVSIETFKLVKEFELLDERLKGAVRQLILKLIEAFR